MKEFSLLLSNQELYFTHNVITYILVFIWIAACVIGYRLNNENTYKRKITIFLICFSFLQEIFDYCNRTLLNDLYLVDIQTDLPLQLCHIAYWFSVLCLFFELYNTKHKQFYFNCAYFLGFSGALQGIITVDLTGIYTFYDMLTLHLQHSLIILNLLWLIFAYNLKFSQRGVIQAFLFTNCLIVCIGIINYFLNSNYMFLCAPPNVNNPFLVGEWPYYLVILELIFFIYGYILLVPFLIIKYLNKNK